MAEVKATKTFSYQDGERPEIVRRGTVLDSSHPAVVGREEFFEAVEPVKRGPGRPPKNRD